MVVRKCSAVSVNISFGAWKLFEKLAVESGYSADKLDGIALVLNDIAYKRHAEPGFNDMDPIVIMRDVREAFKQRADNDREQLVYEAGKRGFSVLIDEGVPELLKGGESINFSDVDCAIEWLYEGSEIQ